MSLATQTLPSIEEAKEVMTMAQIYPRRRQSAGSHGLDVNQQASEVNEGFDAVADVVRPTLRACLGALLVTWVCACGGGGGSSGGSTVNNNPPPPPTSAT